MLPKRIESLWVATTSKTSYPNLEKDMNIDVAVVGGGIAGLTAAYILKRRGLRVAVIEATTIIEGTSGNTTAKITSQHELKYSYLIKKFGEKEAQIYADSNQWAIGEYKRIIDVEKIDCDFRMLPAFTFSTTEKGMEQIRQEVEAAQKLHLSATFVEGDERIPVTITGAVKFDNQACFHPRKFLLSLAQKIMGDGSFIFEKTKATNLKEEGGLVEVQTERGIIRAKSAIIATNYPIYDTGGFFLKMNQMRSYALAVKINSPLPQGMSIGMDNVPLSFRPQTGKEGEWLIVGGQDHVVGESDDAGDRFEKLEKEAAAQLDIKSIDYKWAAQDSTPIDKVPYIGRMPKSKNIFVTTGYGEWGMTSSMVSSRLLADLITGKENKWADLYNPSRIKPLASVKKTVKQGVGTAKGFGSYITKRDKSVEDIKPNEGKIITRNGRKLAVFRDREGKWHIRSAVCTHMGCIVDFNKTEKTWDCPCHGSRFTTNGDVLNGPAIKKLPEESL